jgi:hypothetical protein
LAQAADIDALLCGVEDLARNAWQFSHFWRTGWSELPSNQEVIFDLIDGMLCQILVDFSNNSRLHVSMEGMSQFCQRARRGPRQ